MKSLIDYIEHRAELRPESLATSFLDGHGKEICSYSYAALTEQSIRLSAHLSNQKILRYGSRALLVFPPGLDIIVSFLACTRIGVVSVPISPPTYVNFEVALEKLLFVGQDCDTNVVLTTWKSYRSFEQILSTRDSSPILDRFRNAKLQWIITDRFENDRSQNPHTRINPVLFLQYTSGSTSNPKGVIVSHENVIQNALGTLDHAPICVSWLPQYHDMGLIGYYLFPLIWGGSTYGFAPLDFLRNPLLWFHTMSRVQATYSSAPNFGFDYCLRDDKVPLEQLNGVDLSSLRVLMNASEPVRADTYFSFLRRYSPYGLKPKSHVVAYGLAENTLTATHHGRRVLAVNKRLLLQSVLRIEPGRQPGNNVMRLVSCGKPIPGVRLRIVDHNSRIALNETEIGEIWISGKSVTSGYWGCDELNREVFRSSLAAPAADKNLYLRTGDLGFMYQGELFVCGRIKDVIIIRGIKYYPQDIEAIVEAASEKIRNGGVAAFNGMAEEGLFVLTELRRAGDSPDPLEIVETLREQYYITPNAIIFVPPRTILRTTSGKIARNLTRQRFLEGKLKTIKTFTFNREPVWNNDARSMQRRFRSLLESYGIRKDEKCTFGELGLDSLTLVELTIGIKQLVLHNLTGDSTLDTYIQFLQRFTISEFFSLLAQFDSDPSKAREICRDKLKVMQSQYEGYVLQSMRSDKVLKIKSIKPGVVTSRSSANALLTGATGFLGPFLLESLLRKTSRTYYVLTRADNPRRGFERIRESLCRSRLWTSAVAEAVEKRVVVICGNIAEHNLGLTIRQWRSLADRIGIVLHNAALVNYVFNYDALRPHNIVGTRELLRFSFAGIPKEFHHISTTFIFGWTVKGVLLESDRNLKMENLDFGYSQTKWVAEQLVFSAERHGLPVRIYRPSLISASTSGVWNRNDIAVRLLAFMINHGIAVNSRNQISFLPVDILSDNIASILDQSIASGTLHLTCDNYYNMTDVTRVITANYGHKFDYYDIPEFIQEMNRRCTAVEPLYPLLDFFNSSFEKIGAMQLKRYNNDLYQQSRMHCPGCHSDSSLDDTVSHIMTYLTRERLIPCSCRPDREIRLGESSVDALNVGNHI